jgi:hypothetical protein
MKRPSTEVTVNLLALVAIAALGAWLVFATEWVDVWRPTRPRNEAASDSHYAIKQIAARLGAKVTSPDNLDRLPPPGATLVLESNEWDFLPSRSEQLREWVEVRGGHLVLQSFSTTGATIDWLPLREKKRVKGADLSCPAPAMTITTRMMKTTRRTLKPSQRRRRHALARPTRGWSARKKARAMPVRRSPSALVAMPKPSRGGCFASVRATG